MRIEPLLREASCLVIRGAGDRSAVLARVASAASAVVGGSMEGEILSGLESREADRPTTTPEGVAFPHTVVSGPSEIALIVAVVDPPVRWCPDDGWLTSLVVGLVGSADNPFVHVQLLSRLARVVRSESARDRLRGSSDGAMLLARMIEEDRSHG